MKRKLKVLAVLVVMLIGAAIAGYILWSRGAGTQLDRQVAAYQAAGEPIEPADFIVAHIDDDDNAAVALREAARIDENSKEWKAVENAVGINDIGLPLRDKEVAAFRAVVAVNPNAFGGVDDAMKRKGVDWQIPMKSPVISVLLPDLAEQRQLARLISMSAFLHFHQGDHASALRDINRILFISRTVDLQPTLVSHLVAVGQMNMVADAIGQMAPDLKIGSASGEVSPEQVRLMIAALLNDELPRNGRRRGLQGERMLELDIARCIASGKLDFTSIGTGGACANPAAAAVGVVLKPMALDDGLLMIRQTTKILAAAEASPDWPTFLLKKPPDLPPEVVNAKIRHTLINMAMPSFGRAIENDYRSTTNRRLAALALAIRWYAVDHGGKLPEKLNDLVPQYLPALPLDGLAPGQPLRYVLDPAKPIVYSVGGDGVDDGGSERVAKKNPGSSSTRDKWSQADYVIPLTRQPRPPEEKSDDGAVGPSTPPPATQPSTAPAE